MQTGKIGKRIKEVRKSERLTQTEFGEKIGVKGNTITGYENGTRNPSDSIINYICLLFDINQTWLRTGEGEMHISIPDSSSTLERFFCDQECNNLEMKFLTAYFGLKKKERKAFCELLVKMFPDAMPKIAGNDPLGSPYEVGFQEVSSLYGSTTAEQGQLQPEQQKMPTSVSEDGQTDIEEFVRKHKKNLTAGQEQQILKMMQAMITSQKQPQSVSAQQTVDGTSPKK